MSKQDSGPFLSIVIPAYNEEKRLPPTLVKIADFLRSQPYRSEVIVVENGSTDGTAEVVLQFAADQVTADDPFELILMRSAKGKGNAVKAGMLAARGEYRVVSDTDLAVPISEVSKFVPPGLPAQRCDVAIASREVAGAVRHGEPFYRHLMGRVFNLMVRLLAVPGIQDTQCGFKCFTRGAAERVFPLQRIPGWGFDVEILYIARRHNLQLLEIPVHWYYGDDSRVRPFHDTLSMVRELLKIRRNGRAGLYDTPPSDEEAIARGLPVV